MSVESLINTPEYSKIKGQTASLMGYENHREQWSEERLEGQNVQNDGTEREAALSKKTKLSPHNSVGRASS